MFRSEYYAVLKALAAEKRAAYNAATQNIGPQFVRAIYGKLKASLLICGTFRVAMNQEAPTCVMMAIHQFSSIEISPKSRACLQWFTNSSITSAIALQSRKGRSSAGTITQTKRLKSERRFFPGPNLFFLKLSSCRLSRVRGLNLATARLKNVVRLKHSCGAPVSYKFLQKRLEWFEIIEPKEFAKVQFQKLRRATVRSADLQAGLV